MTVLWVIGILVLLIVTHELGHFTAAKIFKVRVEEFGIGYPPRAFLFGKLGATEYTFNWIPFGGFVRLFGEDGLMRADAGAKDAFSNASKWKQAIILIGGVTANALVAYILFAAALHTGVPRIIDEKELTPGQSSQLIVSDVVPGSPADQAGLNASDRITAVDDLGDKTSSGMTPDSVMMFVRTRGGQPLTVSYERQEKMYSAIMRPANAVVPGQAGRPALGIGLVLVSNQSLDWPAALSQAFWTTQNAFGYVWNSLSTLVYGAFHGTADISQVVGPVGLVSVIGEASRSGLGYVLELAAFIAVNLTIINLIPIPALDGGRLAILGVEALLRRKPPRVIVQFINTVGIALVILLMITVTYHDIARLFA